jgi:hypothetical protein
LALGLDGMVGIVADSKAYSQRTLGLCFVVVHSSQLLEKPERMAALAMLTALGLLVYGLIQRQVRLYLQAHREHVPGNKGPTDTPTATVVLSLFTQVMMVQVQVDRAAVRPVYGWQDHHSMVCDALDIDRSWYAAHPM